MNYRIQEILKMLIPGVILVSCLYLLLVKEKYPENPFDKDMISLVIIIFLVVSYVCGYFIDWFGSIFERLYYKSFPRPSELMFNDNSANPKYRVQLVKKEKIIEYLCLVLQKSSQHPLSKDNALKLFKLANYLKDRNTSVAVKERLNELYFTKIFSRNVMMTFLTMFVCYMLIILFGVFGWVSQINLSSSIFITIPFFVMSMIRWRETAFYYSRAVLYAACEDVLKP